MLVSAVYSKSVFVIHIHMFTLVQILLIQIIRYLIVICFIYVVVCFRCQLFPALSRPDRLQPTRLLCPWDFLGKNTSVLCAQLIRSCPTLQPYGLQPTRLLFAQGSPGKNTGVDCSFLLQGNLPDQGFKLHLLYRQVDSLPLSHQGSPIYMQQCVCVNPSLPVYPSPPFPFGKHKFVFYICDS